ncbi:transglycosylase SLT domain-containing protein [Nonomuraea sp. NPDC052265]|uniref:transglycosylase SLT domain-containing protein n=1 Tax=Nonomuraea sp. NPDC052265 TaxID=3364374 RepID=UPI0037C717D8
MSDVIAVLAPDITEIPGGAEFLQLLAWVTGEPQVIRDLAYTWESCASHAAIETSALVKNVNEVDLRWDGDSADAFKRYMPQFPKAGGEFNTALHACAAALKNVATALERAAPEIARLRDDTVGYAQRYMVNHLINHPNSDEADARAVMFADPCFTGIVNANLEQARGLVRTVQEAVKTAGSTLGSHVRPGENAGFGFFTGIPEPGGPDFDPGDKKVVWTRAASQDGTQVSGGGDSGAGSGSGSGGGSGAGGGSAATSTPAPKAEVVEWIKQALSVIRSPEMAEVMRQRGIDVSDLDPNDPKDVERIWTIIYHESGGNPNAINNWDINAKNGVPSQGLMQTVPPTFNAHALPGHERILDPVDNIIAGVLYTYSRYGNLAGHPGISSLERGGGYRPY